MKGIDISQYQKGINFDSIKKDYDFVIIRGGYTGYGNPRQMYKDECFEEFYKSCKDRGIPVGVYYYSCANSKQFGEMEATFLYDNCLRGKQFQYPVYIDVEDVHWQKNNKTGVTQACIGFCEQLENLGYYVGIYGSDYATFKDMLFIDDLKSYDKWVARWGNQKPMYVTEYGMWQNSNCGKVDNYVGSVDTDESFKNYPYIICQNGLNGYKQGDWGDEDPGNVSNDDSSTNSGTNTSNNSYIEYTVRAGDTLSGIAQKYCTTWQELAKINNIANPNLIYPNHVIKIPGQPQSQQYIEYTVRAGDTLSGIAQKYCTTWQELAKINNVANPNLIYPNQVLKIPK
jgi:LysM repeat protein